MGRSLHHFQNGPTLDHDDREWFFDIPNNQRHMPTDTAGCRCSAERTQSGLRLVASSEPNPKFADETNPIAGPGRSRRAKPIPRGPGHERSQSGRDRCGLVRIGAVRGGSEGRERPSGPRRAKPIAGARRPSEANFRRVGRETKRRANPIRSPGGGRGGVGVGQSVAQTATGW